MQKNHREERNILQRKYRKENPEKFKQYEEKFLFNPENAKNKKETTKNIGRHQ